MAILRRALLTGGAALCLAAPAAHAQGTTTSAAAPATTPSAAMRDELLMQFRSSMGKFIALAEAMPADKYAWSPGPGVMPVAQVFGHVAHYNYQYPATAMGIAAPPALGLDSLERMTNKAELVALLRNSAQHVLQQVQPLPEAQLASSTTLYGRQVPQWAVLVQLVAHMNEHLGQSIAYARMNGVVPPWSQ